MPHWLRNSLPPMVICQKPSSYYADTGQGLGKLTGPPNQRGTDQICACIGIELIQFIALHLQ